jgi:hypothetical protein
MKRLLIVLPLLVVALSCKKAMKKLENDAQVQEGEQPRIVPKGDGNLSVGGGGGGGGAVQGPRLAAARTVNDNNLNQLKFLFFNEMTADPNGKPPSADVIKETIRKEAPAIAAMVKDEIVILTNTDKADGILAYTKWPQRAGKHYAIKGGDRLEMTPDELTKALKSQGTTPILAK